MRAAKSFLRMKQLATRTAKRSPESDQPAMRPRRRAPDQGRAVSRQWPGLLLVLDSRSAIGRPVWLATAINDALVGWLKNSSTLKALVLGAVRQTLIHLDGHIVRINT